MAEDKKEKETNRYVLKDLATQTIPVIEDSQTGKILQNEEILLEILEKVNTLEKLMK